MYGYAPPEAFGVPPTEIPRVRIPVRSHKIPTDTTTFRGISRHPC
jgi:hypothetical protein